MQNIALPFEVRQGVLGTFSNALAAIDLPVAEQPQLMPNWARPYFERSAARRQGGGMLFTLLGIMTDGCYALAAGTAGNWLKRNRAYLEVERYVSGVHFIGLGLTATLAGNQKK